MQVVLLFPGCRTRSRLCLAPARVSASICVSAAAKGGSNESAAAELKEQLRKRRRLNSGEDSGPVKKEENDAEMADGVAATKVQILLLLRQHTYVHHLHSGLAMSVHCMPGIL